MDQTILTTTYPRKIMKKYLRLVYIGCLLMGNPILIHSQFRELILQSPDSGQKDYVARDAITFNPGYQYTATTGVGMTAKTDNMLICHTSYLPYYELPDPDTRTLDQSLPVGAIPGIFNVSSLGGATYNIPLACAPGTAGLAPNLSLVYNSQAGNGWMGMGWQMGGLSMVTPTPQSLYYEDNPGLFNRDHFEYTIDGKRLRRDPNNQDAYILGEFADFAAVRSQNTDGVNGIDQFIVYKPDGSTYIYGESSNERIYNASGNIVLAYLSKVTDAKGNYIQYNYRKITEDGHTEILPESIEYTGNSNTGQAPFAKITFTFVKNRTDKNYTGLLEEKFLQNHLLEKIQVFYENTLQREYVFQYTDRPVSRYQNDSYLVSIEEYTGGALRSNSTIVKWKENTPVTMNSLYVTLDECSTRPRRTPDQIKWMDRRYQAGDLDGDGKDELIGKARYDNHIEVKFTYGSQYEHELSFGEEFFVLDIDMDGKDELVFYQGTKNSNENIYYQNRHLNSAKTMEGI